MQAKLSFTGRIATFSFRHKWYVLAAWLLVIVLAGVASTTIGSVLTTEQKDLSGSESAKAKDIVDERFGDRPLTETVVIRNEGQTVDDPAFQSFVTGIAEQLRGIDGVQNVTTYRDTGDPGMVSADRRAGLIVVALGTDIEQAEKDVTGVLDVVNAAAVSEEYQVHIVGVSSGNKEWNRLAENDLQAGEKFGLPIALGVMVLAFGALVAASVPLLLALASIGAAIGSVALIGRVFELSFFVTNIITMIGLAVGIDYSLFIIGRYREELAKGHDRLTALGIAADTSGRAVFFSGITVLLALAGMLFVRTNIFISIGIGAMVVVLWAVAASLTLLPALLGVIGRAINWARVPFLGKANLGHRFWGRVTHAVQARPLMFVVLSAGLLIAAAAPLATIDLGSNGIESLPKDTGIYQGVTALKQDFAAGRVSPLQVVVDGDVNSPAVQGSIARLKQSVAGRGDLQWMDVVTDPSGRTAIIEIAATTADTGQASQDLAAEMRGTLIPSAFDGSGATARLGGELAVFVDVKAENDTKTPLVFVFVLGLSFLLLLMVFRSIAIPTKAILMNLLSVGAAYGLLVLVFQHGFLADRLGLIQTEQIEFWLPLFLFSILFGLSMDYHVFLLSRVKEEYTRTGDNKQAVAAGVTSTAGMITSAAIIMVAVFAGFARGSLASMQQMGFGLAVAVFLDATIIRSVLVPASMQLLGRYNWWMPSWLEWLPSLNIEGGEHPAPAPVPELVPAGGEASYAAGD